MLQQVNKELVKERFALSLTTYAKEAVVQQEMAINLSELIVANSPTRSLSIFEAGCGCGFLTDALFKELQIDYYTANDLVPECEQVVKKISTMNKFSKLSFISGDIENIDLSGKYDLITGNAVFQWLTDAPKFWQKIAGHLKDNGLIAITLFGEDNFKEISDLTGLSLNYPSISILQNLFSVKYNIITISTVDHILVFNSGRDVLKHIRHTGTGGLVKEHWSKKKLLDFESAYREKYAGKDGKVTLTYQPIYLIAKKK